MFRLQFVPPNRSTIREEASLGYWTVVQYRTRGMFRYCRNAVDAVLRLVQPARMHVITELHP